jgi:hypothetical protein
VSEPRAIIYCWITAALLRSHPGAIWLDTLAAENRLGHHGIWQRYVERRRIGAAPLVLTMADSSLAPLPAPQRPEPIKVPAAIGPSGPAPATRDIDLLAYTGDPVKRRLDDILAVWERAP